MNLSTPSWFSSGIKSYLYQALFPHTIANRVKPRKRITHQSFRFLHTPFHFTSSVELFLIHGCQCPSKQRDGITRAQARGSSSRENTGCNRTTPLPRDGPEMWIYISIQEVTSESFHVSTPQLTLEKAKEQLKSAKVKICIG